jgi:regulator of cell morphogenesis and NO signaling
MNITKDKTVAAVVTENIKASHVFKKYQIDFCCGGGISIEKACEKKGLDPNILIEELHNLVVVSEDSNKYDSWDLAFLADYIVNVHHKYVSESIPILLTYTAKVASVHGHHYKEVLEIDRLFQEAAKELSGHMKKEELILFPYIKHLAISEKEGTSPNVPHFGSISNPIQMMEDEHEVVGNIFKEIARLSNNYTPPKEACNTFRALYDKLNEFETDLHKHIHLENNILHPKALALSRKLIA